MIVYDSFIDTRRFSFPKGELSQIPTNLDILYENNALLQDMHLETNLIELYFGICSFTTSNYIGAASPLNHRAGIHLLSNIPAILLDLATCLLCSVLDSIYNLFCIQLYSRKIPFDCPDILQSR